MRYISLSLWFVILFSFPGMSQPCLPGGITFSTQQGIDNFQIQYPDCTEIEGDVIISGNDITTLEPLHVLVAVNGFL